MQFRDIKRSRKRSGKRRSVKKRKRGCKASSFLQLNLQPTIISPSLRYI
jgi:hypothetical protein